MKKILAILLAMLMLLCSCAYAEAINPDDIPDTIASEDGTYELAFVTDIGQLKDKSFNQGTWNGVKLYAAENNLTYKYYQPANSDEATDADRYDAMKAAAAAGAKIIVAAGYAQAAALSQAAPECPDTCFVFIDGWPLTDAEGNLLTNVAPIAFQEEQCGYLAGYAVVKEGFTKLGFCGGGGGTNAACCRYVYGFAQGAEAAAKEMGVDVELKYSWLYGANFQPSAELQTMTSGWYETGTEIIFACGGPMFDSITAAASANDAFVIGVDTDQSYLSDTVVTSALKGVTEGAYLSIQAYYNGNWDQIGGIQTVLGAAQNAVGLPTETWSLENWSIEEYETMFNQILDGTLVIDANAPTEGGIADVAFEKVTIQYID